MGGPYLSLCLCTVLFSGVGVDITRKSHPWEREDQMRVCSPGSSAVLRGPKQSK